MVGRRVLVRGRVQGVGYRIAMQDTARALGVQGWVRNRRDGCVEAHVQGRADAVEALVAWARVGPPAARVASVEIEETAIQTGLAAFDCRPTA